MCVKCLFRLFSRFHEQKQKPCLFYKSVKMHVLDTYNTASCFLVRWLSTYNKLSSFLERQALIVTKLKNAFFFLKAS